MYKKIIKISINERKFNDTSIWYLNMIITQVYDVCNVLFSLIDYKDIFPYYLYFYAETENGF